MDENELYDREERHEVMTLVRHLDNYAHEVAIKEREKAKPDG